MGLKSGEYGGRNRYLMSHSFSVSKTSFDVCTDELSKSRTSSDDNVGFKQDFMYSAKMY